ncbi:hypothetical protein ACTA71_000073 [Dictyostelium dimigraforme]
MNDEKAKKLHGSMKTCFMDIDGTSLCKSNYLGENEYPNPVIEGTFKPQTKGGQTIMKGYYLVLGITYFTILPDLRVKFVGSLEDEAMDVTNLILDYKGGCGQRNLKWPNDFVYSFNHSNPNIDNISSDNSSLVVVGSNFCNSSDYVNILIDGIQIDKSNIILIDHELFEVKYNQIYCKSINVNIISGGLQSNIFKFDFKPLPIKINSVPKSKGGLIIITGHRLSSPQANNSNISINIGKYVCKNVISTQNEINCYIDGIPSGNNDSTIGLQVKISINGIVNDNELLFSFDVPFISDFILPQGEVKLIGDCLGTIESTQIYIDDIEQLNLTISINDKQTALSFTPLNQIKKSKLYLIVNGIKSNVIEIDSLFFVKSSPSSPSVLGQLVNYTL